MGCGNQREMTKDGRYTIGGHTVTKIVGGHYYGGHLVPGTGHTVHVNDDADIEIKKEVKQEEQKPKIYKKYWFSLQREGHFREWTDKKGKIRKEEALTVRQLNKYPAYTKLGRGLCYRLMCRYIGIKLKKGQQVTISISVGLVNKIGQNTCYGVEGMTSSVEGMTSSERKE